MRRPDLVPDCGSCAAICCVATSFDASEDFAFDKPAGVACRHLGSDHRCRIHEQLIERGCSGCAIFDCYGAGQRVTRAVTGREERSEAFLFLREVHELLWFLTESAELCPDEAVRAELAREVERLDAIQPQDDTDLRTHRRTSRELLARVGRALGGRRGLPVVD